jgi:AcrR family transcriptional regulator
MKHTSNRRQRRRRATIEEIKATAREQIAADGAANLSLGAIARAMGITAPALYRYFENRNALVAALIVDAYDSMADALEKAVEQQAQDDLHGRFHALMSTYRGWALAHSEDYALMFSAPLASPEFSGEEIGRSTMRNLRVMVRLFRAADDAKVLVIPQHYLAPPPSVHQTLIALRSALVAEDAPLAILALSFVTWLKAHGLVWEELHGHLPKFLFSSGDLYEMEIRVLAVRLGLTTELSATG